MLLPLARVCFALFWMVILVSARNHHHVTNHRSIKKPHNPTIYPGGEYKFLFGWNKLPKVEGARIDTSTFKLDDKGTFVTTYITENYDPKKIKRALIHIHGISRDGWNQWMYSNEAGKMAADHGGFSMDQVVIAAPVFFSNMDKGAYPVDEHGASSSRTIIWDANNWGHARDAILPVYDSGRLANPAYKSSMKRKLNGISRLESETLGPHRDVMDALDVYLEYFTDKSRFPNLEKVVVAGFSMGAQVVNRYTTLRPNKAEDDRIIYWMASPGSYVYLNQMRPVHVSLNCTRFNSFKYGLEGHLPAYFHRKWINNTLSDIRDRYMTRKTVYLVGGADSSAEDQSCMAKAQGKAHRDRMHEFVTKHIPSLPNNPTPGSIPKSVLYAQIEGIGHNAYRIMTSTAGMQSLYLEDFYGPGNHAAGPRVLRGGDSGMLSPDAM